MRLCVCVCVCVCVCERERESVSVCACICVGGAHVCVEGVGRGGQKYGSYEIIVI